jgi:tRNA nucleotidyltransferase (CCA-adding enzyme)
MTSTQQDFIVEADRPDKNNLTLIATHTNADFDALASLLAAQKLYPHSLVLFPGSQEKNLRNFFIKSMGYLFNMGDFKSIDPGAVKRLVLVDTRQLSRIGEVASLLNKEDIEIHIYDHHPPMDNDIRPDFGICRPTGATVTLLAEILKEKKIEISADEATVLCLGIYEDTGSFTFPSTTEYDHMAAAFLLSKGANLKVVADLIAREISPGQLHILNDMIQAATRYNINGIEVVVTTVTYDDYIDDFAFLVHKMVKMENIEALFALARMGNKIYIVARSRAVDVDVASILSPFGGGGHVYAASASIKDKTMAQTENELIGMLYQKIRPKRLARDLMSSPAITVEAGVSCKEASTLLTRYNINALIVLKELAGEKSPVGFINRQVIEKALFHGLGNVPVQEYMNNEPLSVGPLASLSEIQDKIIENKQRILPVIENGAILGVITRTDLLTILVGQATDTAAGSQDPHRGTIHARTRNIVKFMRERLSPKRMEILESLGDIASGNGMDAYVVGGFVRDLFLYRNNEDIDIVIEGDGIGFAKEYAKIKGARVHTHEKFGTAVIIFADGFKIDVASARMEYYKFPAALPTVEMSSIKLDLFRRDFTINTLAIHLNPRQFGTLIDFFSAQRDLKGKVIRVLHNLSFVEDPTRVFRAIRFEQRFGFSIGKLTSGLIENTVKMDFFKRMSGGRVFSELKQILQEDNPVPAIIRLKDFDLMKFVDPSIRLGKNLVAMLNNVKNVVSWFDLLFLEESYMTWAVYFIVLIRNCDKKTTHALCDRMGIAPRHRLIFTKERFEAEACLAWLEKNTRAKNSAVFNLLSGCKTELILALMAMTQSEAVKRSISNYFTHLRFIKPLIKGEELMAMGYAPGPIFREILTAIQNFRLDGEINTKADELEFARNYNPAPDAG